MGAPLAELPPPEPEDDDELFMRLAAAVWQQTRQLRRALHGRNGDPVCPTWIAPYSISDPSGRCPRPGCEDCLSEFHLVLTQAWVRARKGRNNARDLDAWLAEIAKNEAITRYRQLRTEQGALARTDPRGKVAAIYRHCPTPWHRHLAKLMLDYAGWPDPLPATFWPLDRWVEEKAKLTGVWRDPFDRANQHEIGRDIGEVLDIMTAHGGTVTATDGRKVPWVDRYVLEPLGRRVPAGQLSLDAVWSGPDGTLRHADVAAPPVDLRGGYADRVADFVRAAYSRGQDPATALRVAMLRWFGARGAAVLKDEKTVRALVRALIRDTRREAP